MHFSTTLVAMVASLAMAAPTTSPAPPCLSANKTYSCRNNKTPKFNCPTKGQLKKPAVMGAERGVATLNKCRDICLSHANCETFRYVQNGGLCTQYSRDLPHMGLVKDSKATGVMYNRHCFICDNGTPITSSSSSTAPSPTTMSSAAAFSTSTSSDNDTATTSSAAAISTSTGSGNDAATTSSPADPATSASDAATTSSPADPATTTSDASTSTTSTSSDPAATSPAPSTCGNAGLAWAQYASGVGENTDNTYSNFDPVAYKTMTPGCSGTTTTIAGFHAPHEGDNAFTVYDNACTFNSRFFALDHVGYLYAPVTGTYTITTQDTDDAIFLWTGGKAVQGWTRDNADAVTNMRSNYGISSTQVTATAGSYTPIRVMYAQAQEGGGFRFKILDPSGNELLADGQQQSGYIVQYGCGADAQAAPAFPAWGQES